jgi:hypothetical protein
VQHSTYDLDPCRKDFANSDGEKPISIADPFVSNIFCTVCVPNYLKKMLPLNKKKPVENDHPTCVIKGAQLGHNL